MKRNEDVFFTRDGKTFSAAKFLHNCGEKDAVKILMSDGEWTVLRSEVVSYADREKKKAEAFYAEHKALIDGFETCESKAQLARDMKRDYRQVCRILKNAEFYGLLPAKVKKEEAVVE